jgi:hypothetical protein
MKTFSFLIILPLMTLTACTQWEKPGAGNATRDMEYAECKARGYERFPPDVVRDFEFSYENQYQSCKKDKKRLPGRLPLRKTALVQDSAERS